MMDVGMLWFDADRQQDIYSRIQRASTYYRSKYGRNANLCYVHPSTVGSAYPKEVDGLKVLTSQTVLPDHFWLGVERNEKKQIHPQRAA
jgi:hypothetical protein